MTYIQNGPNKTAPLKFTVEFWRELHQILIDFNIIMRPSSLGGGRILRHTLSARLSVRPSRYRCHR